MKKTLYMIVLVVSAIVGGSLIGSAAQNAGSLKWLGYSKSFDFQPGTFINTDVLKLNFGFYISFNVAQILLVLLAIFVYYKTAPKLITGK